MYKYFFILYFFFIFSCGKTSQEVSIPNVQILKNDSQIKQKNGILFFQEIPFSGVVLEKYDGDILKSKTEYWKGKKHGSQIKFYRNGSTWEKRFFKKNIKEGIHQAWWPNKNRKFEYTFLNGNYEGNYSSWYQSGEPYESFNFKKGKEIGSQKVWNKDGKIRSNYVVKKGRRYGLIGSKPCYTVNNEK